MKPPAAISKLAMALCSAPLLVHACHCLPTLRPDGRPYQPPLTIKIPEKRPGAAIFVGTVESIYPKNEDFPQIWKTLFGKMPSEGEEPPLEHLRRFILHVYGGMLTPPIRERIAKAASVDEIHQVNIIARWLGPRRIIFRVTEAFSETTIGSFTLYTGSGGGDCGIDFRKGQRWMVDAYKDDAGNWIAHTCSATAPASQSKLAIAHLRTH